MEPEKPHSEVSPPKKGNVINSSIDIEVAENALKALNIQSDIDKSQGTCSESKNLTQEEIKIREYVSETTEKLVTPQVKENKKDKIEEEFDEELKSLQCPFTWNLQNKVMKISAENIIAVCNEKLNIGQDNDGCDENQEEDEFQWRRFILVLIICHLHFISGNLSEATAKQEECENLIKKCESNEKLDMFFQKIKVALLHIVYACKCYLFVSSNKFNEAVELKQSISRYEHMDKSNLAAIFGIQSAILMEFGYEGTKVALEYAKKAITLDGNEGEWHFLHGKILGRIRRVENPNKVPDQEELSELELAVSTAKNASSMVFLAQAYREAASKVFWSNQDNLEPLQTVLDKMNEKSLQLYWEALILDENSTRINTRVAAGLLKLPPPYRDMNMAEECIEKALKIGPNAMTYHVAGNLYERQFKYDLAQECYKKAGDLGAFGAYANLITLKFRMDRNYDPVPELEALIQRFTEDSSVQEAELQLGSYFLFFKNDLLTALDYWMKGIEVDPNAEKIKNHRCMFLNMQTINLYQMILDEIQLALEQKMPENENKLRKILIYCTERYPELLSNKPQSWRENSWKPISMPVKRTYQANRRGGYTRQSGKQQQWKRRTQEEQTMGNSGRSGSINHRDNQPSHLENWRSTPRNTSLSEDSSNSGQKYTSSGGGSGRFREKDNQRYYRAKSYHDQEQAKRGERWQDDKEQRQQNQARGSWRSNK